MPQYNACLWIKSINFIKKTDPKLMNSTVWSPTHLDFCAVKLFENNIHIYIYITMVLFNSTWETSQAQKITCFTWRHTIKSW